MHGSRLAFVLLSALLPGTPRAQCPQAVWTTLATPPPGNTLDRGHVAADPQNNVVYVKSDSAGDPATTFTWNGSSWSTGPDLPVVAGTQVAGLKWHALAYDSGRQRVVLFGGSPFSHTVWDRTLEWDGTTWTESPAARPPGLARHEHAMAYDAQRSKIVVFGGDNNVVHFGDTWTYDGTTWTQAATTGPSNRRYPAMAYDPISREVVLFGGREPSPVVDKADTWVWNGTAWAEKSPAHSPSARSGHYMTYDAARQRVVLHGGVGVDASETWEWDGADWHLYSNTGLTDYGPMAYDPGRSKIVGFWSTNRVYCNPESGHVTVTSPLWSAATVSVGSGGSQPRSLAVVTRASGRRDLAVANAGADAVAILTNDGSGNFTLGSTVALPAPAPVAVARGNLDGGAVADDLAVACANPVAGVFKVARILDAGAASQSVDEVPLSGRSPAHVACGELTGDPLDDIVVACLGEFGVGAGIEIERTLGAHTQLSTKATERVALSNFDQIAGRDIVGLGQSPDTLDFYANDGSGAFTPAGSIALGSNGTAKGLCCADMDGDGDTDIVVLVPELFGSNRFRVYLNQGTLPLTTTNVGAGKFTALAPITVAGAFAYDVACGDFEDDTIDAAGIAFQGKSRRDVCIVSLSGDVGVHDGFDGTTFGSTLLPSSGTNPVACLVEDLDNDGCDDLVIANAGSGTVTVNRTVVPSIAAPFATGCAGSSGVPAIGTNGTPNAGATAFTVSVASARANSLALLAFGLEATNAPGSTCGVFLAAPIVSLYTFTSGAGTSSYTFGIPASVPKGVDAYMQWAVFDPSGAFLGTLALSNALRIQIGN